MAHSSTSATPAVPLDANSGQTIPLVSSAAYARTPFVSIRIKGEDRFRWLNGMVSNTIEGLAPGAINYNFVLNAQGRIQGDLYVWRENDHLTLEIESRQAETLLSHLDHYIIMDDVELIPEANLASLDLIGPQAATILASLSLPAPIEPLTFQVIDHNGAQLRIARHFGSLPHYRIWAEQAPLAALESQFKIPEASAEDLEALRIAEGIPAFGTDITARELPQETAQTRALHFSKGCYLGQEIVERIRSRGNVHRHLRSLFLTGTLPAPGAKLTLGDAEAGHITSAAHLPGAGFFAIALVSAQHEALAEQNRQPFAYEGGTASLQFTLPHRIAVQQGNA